jgi:hypothetical protein
MPQARDNIITGAIADPTTLSVRVRVRVRVTWANGGKTVNRFDHRLGTGVFAAAAGPAVFAQVRVGEGGRSLEWPGEIDFCADALWFEAHPTDAPRPADLPASATYE